MSYMVEVVNVECLGCGLVSNWVKDWECIYNEEYDYWYYLCPKCANE